ncbi:hypothetical protein [Phaeovulum vinaykumarii]|uniref:Uncharacterized protein n=1 Tax=Phaeovulum vinaykumarii TaxID=407234 RepID=A0A1N7M3H2_9RHOB|nr:hypothetical protein [Phaeovulum vinaykumarii]SIS80593.1 hypothetical protein SAMN05421795_105136 [Phaeovulum vinaykumarii]SOC09112.1 hypothetical protein SAMN05878426_10566 [Phaeovulum vinaykumarii]
MGPRNVAPPPVLQDLPPGVSARVLPAFFRIGGPWAVPQVQYSLPLSGLKLVHCADPATPVIFTGGSDGLHIFPAAPPTVRCLIAVLRDDILGRVPLRGARFEVGDGIVLARQWGRWGIVKTGEGMGPERLAPADLEALAVLLEHALAAG